MSLIGLCTGNFDTEFFRQALPNFFRKPVMNAARSLLGSIEHRYRSRSGHRHSQPNQSRERESCQSSNFQPECVTRPQMTDHAKRQQKYSRRHRCQRNQSHVNDAVKLLPAAAVFTCRQVTLVVAAHFCRQTGNIVPPPGQNLADDWINALLTHEELSQLNQIFGHYKQIGVKASVWVARSTRFENSPPRVASAFSASLRAISG